MPNPVNRNPARTSSIPEEFVDTGDDRGFGGMVGANRHIPPFDHTKVETLPVSQAANYGPAPGLNPAYGSRGIDGDPVTEQTEE